MNGHQPGRASFETREDALLRMTELTVDKRRVHTYAPPISIPTASTMPPPSTIWNAACRNGVSM
jgi:hypothetical protein